MFGCGKEYYDADMNLSVGQYENTANNINFI